jgi:hypothetical protein
MDLDMFSVKLRTGSDERRIVIVPISFPLLQELCTEATSRADGLGRFGRAACTSGLPRDSLLVGSFTDGLAQRGYMIFWHHSFPSVDPSITDLREFPQLIPVFQLTPIITPVEGVEIDLRSEAEITITFNPLLVDGEFVQRPGEYQDLHTADGGRFRHQQTAASNSITLRRRDATFRDRVRHIRDDVRGRANSFFSSIFPDRSADERRP